MKTIIPYYKKQAALMVALALQTVVSVMVAQTTYTEPVYSTGQNYVSTKTYQKATTTGTVTTVGDVVDQVQYVDGLGRPVQAITVKGSPAKSDMVQPTGYDDYGREDKKYLPYISTANGSFDPNAIKTSGGVYSGSSQYNYYQGTTGIPSDVAPYAQTIFEPSPLNRMLKQGSPGNTWQPTGDLTRTSSEHVISLDYRTNTSGEVTKWDVSADNKCSSTSKYAAGTLYVTETTDENGNPMKEYKDLEGHVVLKSSFDGTTWLQTYYVYDDFGLLRFVLPPKAIESMVLLPAEVTDVEIVATGNKVVSSYGNKSYQIKPTASVTLSDGFTFTATASKAFVILPYADNEDIIDKLGYNYTYDKRNRMGTKKLPGADPVYMVYDNRDRLVLTQDGEQRKTNKWFFTKYDELNRPAVTGILTYSAPKTQAEMQIIVDGVYSNAPVRSYFVTRNNTGETGYADGSFPMTSDGTLEYLTATYYDTYSFPGQLSFDDANGINISGYSDSQGDSRFFENITNRVTGNRVKVLGSTTWLTTTNYYDDQYRVIQTRRNLFDGSVESPAANGSETLSTLYDFVSKVKQSKQRQIFGTITSTLGKFYYYDHIGRLIRTEQELNGDHVTVSELTYNELGQLVDKGLHYNSQNIDYTYNIRGWLESINNPDDITHVQPGDINKDLFAMRLLYQTPDAGLGNTALFNGNITGVVWQSDQKAKQGYGYRYDALNRLKESDYRTNPSGTWTNSEAYEEKSIRYDANGNITHLQRTDKNGADMANYNYAYTGNQLQRINALGDYTYDKNGNTQIDGVRGLWINYNVLNLPTGIISDDGAIYYIYSAAGEKVAKQNTHQQWQYYTGNMVYNNDKSLDYVLFDEGMIRRTEINGQEVFTYEYYLKDHLGNTRVVFEPNGTSTTITTAQVTDYYPFGTSFAPMAPNNGNKYQYNGKELQDDKLNGVALDWLDYGARFYDPQIGRFTTLDPKAEKFYPASPYSYVVNNPVILTDPNGEDWTIERTVDKDGKLHYTINLTVAVLNSSGKDNFRMDKFMDELKNQTESLFTVDKDANSEFDVTCNVSVTEIKDKKDVGSNTLVEIKPEDSKDFKNPFSDPKDKSSFIPGSANNGKEIGINVGEVPDINQGRNKKVLAHELGHTAGLNHPQAEDAYFTLFPDRNFMRQGRLGNKPTGVTRSQITRMYLLYTDGDLNKSTGIHPIDIVMPGYKSSK